jgi:hypothetical protein
MTIIRVATPSIIPKKEKPAMTDTNPSALRARKYRHAIIRSKGENITP